MSLKQYAFTRSDEETTVFPDPEFEWQNHSQLQDWVEALYSARYDWELKDNERRIIDLCEEDIDFLICSIERARLMNKPTSKAAPITKAYYDKDLEFCDWARKIIEDGNSVFYFSHRE